MPRGIKYGSGIVDMSDTLSEELLTRSAQIEGIAIGDAGGHRHDFGRRYHARDGRGIEWSGPRGTAPLGRLAAQSDPPYGCAKAGADRSPRARLDLGQCSDTTRKVINFIWLGYQVARNFRRRY